MLHLTGPADIQDRSEDAGLELRSLLRVLRRRFGVVLLSAAVLTGAALALSLLQDDRYTAEATLLFRDPQLDQKLFGSSLVQDSTDDARKAATNLELVSQDVVAERTARALGPRFTKKDVQDAVHISAKAQADVASIEATDRQPATAARIANTFAQEYIRFRRNADRAKVAEAQDLVQRQLSSLPPAERNTPSARSLRQRLQELEILTSLQTGNAEQIQVAQRPDEPSSPKPLRNTALGLALGLLLGIAMAFVADRFDRRLRDPSEVSDVFGRPILATVPATTELVNPARPLPPAAAEAFRMLRANLRYYNVDQTVRSVLVTSPQPGDGKSTVAWNLASAAASGGARTLLLEADLRRPSLGRWMHEAPRVGLSGLLSHQGDLQDVVTTVSFGEGNGAGPTHEIDVIFAGPIPPNPDELIESDRMRDIIETAERDYDLVVIDTPPTSVVSDAIPLIKEVSGVLVVARVGRTTRDSATHLAHQLQNLNARVLGVVVNHLRQRRHGYGYTYAYGYEAAPEDRQRWIPSRRRERSLPRQRA
jgi:polysaccharide biosynthesis transport protein